VDLHDEARAGFVRPEPRGDGDHGSLDDVGGRALHRGVDGAALGVLAELRVARVDLGQVQPPAEHRADIPQPPRALASRIHVAAHARVTLEVAVDVSLGLTAFEAQLLS
jgi:hypothetical protein